MIKKDKKQLKKWMKKVRRMAEDNPGLSMKVMHNLIRLNYKKGPEKYMDIWEKLYKKTKKLYKSDDVNDIFASAISEDLPTRIC